MKIISDIRLYKSSDVDKHVGFTNKSLNIVVRRVVMKLREQKFSLGEFDHLYVNFTVCIPEDKIELVDKIDSYHPWYRYCNVGINQNDHAKFENDACINYVYDMIKAVLQNLFNTPEDIKIIETAFSEAKKGPEMLMYFKEKKSSRCIARIFLRLLDNGKFSPLLSVTDMKGFEIFKADLPETVDLNIIGDIQLTDKKVTVKPRKNATAKDLQPITFDIKL